MARVFMLCTVIAAVSLISIDSVDAQRAGRVKVNQALRFLGNGWSGGYHWRTPGYDVDYYNPYSRHNSVLTTGGVPQGAGSYLSRMGYQNGGYVDDFHASAYEVAPGYQNGFYHQGSGVQQGVPYNSMPTVDPAVNYPTPRKTQPNVVDSEVVKEQSPEVDYRKGSEPNPPEKLQKTIPVDRQPSPSDAPADKDDEVGMWKGFDELESIDRSSFAGSGR